MAQANVQVVGSLLDAMLGLLAEAKARRQASAARIHDAAFVNAPEETGALKASLYMVDEDGSTYGPAVSAAQGKNPDFDALPEVQAEADTTIVAVAAGYGFVNEYYTGPKNAGAHPYFTPAVEAERPRFEADGKS